MNLTEKIKQLLDSKSITRTELSQKLGITRKTLNVRLEKSNWKKLEVIELQKL